MSTREQTSPAVSSRATVNTQRVLACVLCQQRKVKCDRKFPCANCVRSGAKCVPAALASRQRRRRFPERELLERLRHYEDLLRQNNIEFEPLHGPAAEKTPLKANSRHYDSQDYPSSRGLAVGTDGTSKEQMTVKSETVYEAKNFWHAMNQRSQTLVASDDNNNDDSDSSADGVGEGMVKKALDQLYESNDQFLFGLRKTNIDLSTLHPDQVQIFRLWQIYLENVNSLLKVTHTPTLQTLIIDAASDVANVSPPLEALIFSIYCVSILSLDDDECRTLFKLPRKDLLQSYRVGCQQALLNCGLLRSSDRNCLTALYLYLVSIRPDTDPRSLSAMLGVAMRMARRLGIHNESANAKCTILEAEMRRRLWWSLIIFDTRISEMSDYKVAMLDPTWDCSTPLNVNDFDLRPEMKDPPAVHKESTEALFTVVRSELSNYIRHSTFHLDFLNPILKSTAKDISHSPIPEGSALATLEKTVEDKHLKYCNLENPLHFITIWTARGYLAKNYLMEHYSRYPKSTAQQTDAQRDAAVSQALKSLECDTKLMNSPLMKGYHWLIHFQFPFPAYIHIIQDLRRRPVGKHAEEAWNVMSDNYQIRFRDMEQYDNPFFKILSRIVLQAWAARDVVSGESGKPKVPPLMVSDIRQKVTEMTSNAQKSNIDQPKDVEDMNSDNFSMPMPMDFGGHDLLYSDGGQGSTDPGSMGFPEIPGQAAMEVDIDQLDWGAIDWNSMLGHGW